MHFYMLVGDTKSITWDKWKTRANGR